MATRKETDKRIFGLPGGTSLLLVIILLFVLHFSSPAFPSDILVEDGRAYIDAAKLKTLFEQDGNALEQAKFIWAQDRKNDFSMYNYEVLTQRNDSRHGLLLEVHEYLGEHRNRSGGGTSFHAVWKVTCPQSARALSMASCTVKDNFNGFYLVSCPTPPMYHEKGISQLTLEVEFINFEPFKKYAPRPPGKARQAVVYQSHWVGEEVRGSSANGEKDVTKGIFPAVELGNLPICVSKEKNIQGNPSAAAAGAAAAAIDMTTLSLKGQWVAGVQGTLRWAHATEHCVTPIWSDDQVAQCLERVGPIVIVGDSHLRRISKWLLGYLGFAPEQLTYVGDGSVAPTIRFFFSTTGSDLYKRVIEDDVLGLQAINGTGNTSRSAPANVVIMNNCHWDFWNKDLANYIESAAPAVLRVVKTIREQPGGNATRIIWVSCFPMPPQYDGAYRNEFSAQFADSLLVPQLEVDYDVEVLHVGPVISPRIEGSEDDHHYISETDKEGRPLGNEAGSVGREISRMLTQMLCGEQRRRRE